MTNGDIIAVMDIIHCFSKAPLPGIVHSKMNIMLLFVTLDHKTSLHFSKLRCIHHLKAE